MTSTHAIAETAPRKSLSMWMNQSTIYRRHEARLARSSRLKDDPRPPIVRVLSLLPGFHILIPRYEPNNETTETQIQRPIGDEYSEETRFLSSLADSTCTTNATTTSADSAITSTSASTILYRHPMSPTAWHMTLQALATTAASTSVAHSLFGIRQQYHNSTNPFQQHLVHPHRSHSSTIFQFLFGRSSSSLPRISSLITPLPQFVSTTTALFATRVYLNESSKVWGEVNPIITASAAGGVSGLVSLLWEQRSLASLYWNRHLGLHMVGGILYFGTYDCLRNGDASIPGSCRSLGQTAMAGAVAGSLYAAVTTPRWSLMTCFRAAPTHAFLWCIWEWVVVENQDKT